MTVTAPPGPPGDIPTASLLRLGKRAGHAIADWWGEKPLSQLAVIIAVVVVLQYLGHNTLDSMQRFGLTPGFDFLDRTAGFEIGESWISYSAQDSFGRAIIVGLLNTLAIAVLGCFLATVLGVALGVARLSKNPLLSRLVQAYVEVIRNTPLLLQLFFWNLTIHALPPPRQAIQPFAGFFLTNRGIFFPWIEMNSSGMDLALAIAIGLLSSALTFKSLKRKQKPNPGIGLALATTAIVGFSATLAIFGAWPSFDLPSLRGFNIGGGRSISPEFACLLIGLSVNSSAAICETVRAGIQSVPTGQWEAARALGLSPRRLLRHIVLPQALRVIVPLITSTYVALIKHSSIAVAIGFPDLVNVLNTTANQSGQAIEAILIMLIVYLSLSLATSIAMNVYNHHIAMRGALRP